MSDTPETDQAERVVLGGVGGDWKVTPADFARRLERERDEQRKYNAQLTAVYLEASGELQKERDALREENRKLREALQANLVFHTPIELRKNGGVWDEYKIDAIRRTQKVLSM